MRKAIFLILTLAAPSFAIADHHALTLEANQAEMAWQITSIDLTSDESVITVERESDEGGRSYVSYHLSYDSNGNGGTYTFQGRAYVDEETTASGTGVGVWTRDGLKLSMHQLINISDGTINFDKVTFDPLNRTGTIDVYALK